MTTVLNVTGNPVDRVERVKVNENWDRIVGALNDLQMQINVLSGGEDVKDILDAIKQALQDVAELEKAIERADIATNNANEATTKANQAADNTNQAIADAETATQNAEQAIADMNLKLQEVTQKLQDIQTAINEVKRATQDADDATTSANIATRDAQTATNAINAVLPNVTNLENMQEWSNSIAYKKNNFVTHQGNGCMALRDNIGIAPPIPPVMFNNDWAILVLKGDKGDQGTGVNIKGTLNNEGELPPTGSIGDAYMINGHLYVWSDTTSDWVNVGQIQGPQGIQGIQGPKGDKGDPGQDADLTQVNQEIVNLQQTVTSNQQVVTEHLAEIAVNVRNFGAKGDGVTDDTAAIQNAIDYANTNNLSQVYVPGGTYMIKAHDDSFTGNYMAYGNVEIKSNMSFIMSKKAILKAIPNDKGAYNILTVVGQKNVVISGGNLAGDKSEHLGSTGEWGYGIAILGSENVVIQNVEISDCWGDGINLQWHDVHGDCTDITIDGVISNNNRRQGLSIESADKVTVKNSIFKNTNGTAPQAGIDVEPWNPSAKCNDILIDGCFFENNTGPHILLHNNKNGIIISNCRIGTHSVEGVNVNKDIDGLIFNSNIVQSDLRMYPKTNNLVFGKSIISNNLFTNASVTLSGGTLFTNNKIEGSVNKNGISILEKETVVANNLVRKSLNGITSYEADLKNVVISDNALEECIKAIDLNSNGGHYCQIKGNSISNNKENAIFLIGINNAVIANNIICTDSLSSTDVYYGILINSKNKNIEIANNTVKSNINKFKNAIIAANFSENENIKVYYNNIKGSTVDTSKELMLEGVASDEQFNIKTT